jgi:acetyltransferase-like isoleucine patch superfamily enzyme
MKVLYVLIKFTFLAFIRHIKIARIQSRSNSLVIELPTLFHVDDCNVVEFGRNVHIGAFSEIVVVNESRFSIIPGRLSVGNGVIIGSGANIRAAGGEIKIGDNSLIAQNVSLIAANHSITEGCLYRDAQWDTNRSGVVIEENAWIGANVILLPGVKVGKNSIVAAGAVVTKPIPSNEIWAGVPARHIGFIKNDN